MKQKIPVKDLHLGMFVAELDRPWLESPFLFQGFIVDSDEELGIIQNICEHVFVDAERSTSERQLLAARADDAGRDSVQPTRFRMSVDQTAVASRTVKSGLIKMIGDRRLGRMVDPAPVRESVLTLLNAVLENPQAALWLTKLREQDELTAAHSLNVAIISIAFAQQMGFEGKALEAIGTGALLHDIGLTEQSSRIIIKKSGLTEEEFSIVRKHPVDGLFTIRRSGTLDQMTLDIIRWHHERVDGSGYPDGLAGDAIPDHVRIVGIADAYDAMASDRVYRLGMQPSDVLLEMHREASQTFGREMVQAFIRCIGIYPVGSLVRLNTGALALVAASRDEARLTPLVLLIRDTEGRELRPRQLIDLSGTQEKTGVRWQIQEVVNPETVGINLQDLLREEQLSAR